MKKRWFPLPTVGNRDHLVPPRPEITRHLVKLEGLPSHLDGLRLMQISDFHIGPTFQADSLRHIVALSNSCRPDLVVLTGDFPGSKDLEFLRQAAGEFSALHAPLGRWACLGNHDHWEGLEEVQEILREAHLPVLVNENRPVAEGLWLAGIDDLMAGRVDWERTVAGLPEDAAVVLLSHNPSILPRVADWPWLILAGHTHGGQIALPFLGPRRTARVPGIRGFMYAYEGLGVWYHRNNTAAISSYRYPAGWYQEGRARMYVNRGVGFSQTYPFRLFCPPEIACFTLQAVDG